MAFDYRESWLERPSATPLSRSLPLRRERFTLNECRGFFAGILPEESKREIIARNLGISSQNDFAMLERIGGECAGAVTFVSAGEPLPEKNGCYRALSDKELMTILKTLPQRPLLAGEEGVRLSLAGAQDKIGVGVTDGKITLPLGGALSTHILKPDSLRFAGLIINEALCLTLADAVGIPAAKASVHQVDGLDYLLIERYDRKKGIPSRGRFGVHAPVRRLHQEDFCQALGIAPEMKYQSEGGPSLEQCFALLRETSSAPVIDLQRLLDAVIFNMLIGNHDAHGKNFSLLYDEGGTVLEGYSTRLAPLYDTLSTVFYPELSGRMAMKIGGEYESNKIFPRHFEKLAESVGLAKSLVKKRVPELTEAVIVSLTKIDMTHPVASKVAALIMSRCHDLLEKFRRYAF